MTKEQQEQLQDLLSEMGLTHDSFYGKLVINFQGGKIIGYDRGETLKLTEQRR